MSLLAGLATSIGGLLVILMGKVSRSILNFIIGVVAGMMLAISFMSLVFKAMELAGLSLTAAGFALGSIMLLVIDFLVPHIHLTGLAENMPISDRYVRKGVVTSLGIGLHNIPEGIAVASSFSIDPKLGALVALVIGAHNIPEGVVTAIPLRQGGLSNLKTFFITLLSGLTEPAAAAATLLLLQEVSHTTLAISSAFAAGAMVYITIDELIPEAYAHGQGHSAILGLTMGVLVALFLMSLL